jgi:hypothetical protein
MSESEQALARAHDAQVTARVSIDPKSREHPTYSVSTWDHEIERWYIRERRASKWELRQWLRKLYAESWDHVSILIERND